MPKLSALILSILSIFILAGAASSTVLPRNIRREVTAPYCEDRTGRLITTLRRDVHGDYNANVEAISDSTPERIAAPLCSDNSQCNLGQICNQGFCVAGSVAADAPQIGADVLSAPNAARVDASAGAVSWEEEDAEALEMCEVVGLAASTEALCVQVIGLRESKHRLPVVALNVCCFFRA
ncbi:DNA repair protein RAD51 [Aspergillus tubingensis]|uniref:DNA repair protein RAD51 n=1 Tax=Aspergillus tubingensis TaxID=5068 RepID=UPI0015793FA2|nr:DNA repair protein RAD51 [Aspergillus tubingensis]GFN19110.1 DNA repair protein RAD51 [Aspergillus tubingensis]